jgi:integrase
MAPGRSRNRTLTDEEYKAFLKKMPGLVRRACIMPWETCLSRKDLLGLTWEEINTKDEMIELRNARAKN